MHTSNRHSKILCETQPRVLQSNTSRKMAHLPDGRLLLGIPQDADAAHVVVHARLGDAQLLLGGDAAANLGQRGAAGGGLPLIEAGCRDRGGHASQKRTRLRGGLSRQLEEATCWCAWLSLAV